jgi:hypothetical protein
MVELLDLVGHRRDDRRVGMAEGAGGNSGDEIQILTALGIPNATACSPFKG